MPTFRFRCIPTLPRLAWCASLTASTETGDEHAMDLWHGPWVETTSTGFVEGAWDGDFAGGRFDQAAALFGSGGHIEGTGWLFATPTHMLAHLFSITLATRLLISNSLAFLLAQADDSLDLKHSRYYFDFLHHRRLGLHQPPGGFTIPTARGRRIGLHAFENLVVLPDRSLSARPKTHGSAPIDFDSYRDLLQTSLQRLIANAADPLRRRRFRPIIALSQGLDSPAVAALAVDCREALTFVTPEGAQTPGDNAAPLAQRLGLALASYDRHAYRQLPGAPEAEFCAGMSFGAWAPLAAAESQIEGAMLLMGNYGDDIWTTAANKVLPDLLAPTDSLVEAISVNEFRLRAGFVFCPAPWIGAAHGPAIHSISISAVMRPWRGVGGSLATGGDRRRYDRPIPRRIIEDSGIPRAAFGQRKVGGMHRSMVGPESMSPAGYSDFRDFLAARIPARQIKPWHNWAIVGERLIGRLHIWMVAALRRLPQKLYLRVSLNARLPLVISPATGAAPRDLAHPLWRSPYLYTFHWGINCIQHRYSFESESGLDVKSGDASRRISR